MEKITVIIPAYNEEKRLGYTLQKWQKFLAENPNCKIPEIIIVDDGSQDATVSVAKTFENILPIKIVQIKPNRGKGFAVKTGVKDSIGDLIFICDADSAVLPKELDKLLAHTDIFDVVIGSRTAKGSETKMSFSRKFIGVCFHIICLPLIPGVKDASCGAKLFRSEAAKVIFSTQKIERFAFDIEILWLAKKLGFKIKEVGIEWREIPGSKINVFRDGLEMLICVFNLYKKQLTGKI